MQCVLRYVDDGLVSVGRIVEVLYAAGTVVVLDVVSAFELKSRREGDAEVRPVRAVVF